jgi:ABC-type proline/glycine betaine transport system ATPase subunit
MIAIESLSKSFGKYLALDHIELTIGTGELFFLLGPSGCGKTTLLRHIAGFYQPDEGRILFDNKDVTRLPAHQRNTGMVFQNYALWPHLTVEKNVAFGLEERRLPKAEIDLRVAEALRAVRLEELARRKIHEMSGGQQQRVALARALVVRPACLLLDEPLSNLDSKLRLEMRQEIRRICREFRLTSIYVTHDQQEALSIADRIAILNAGQLLQVGALAEIYRHPANVSSQSSSRREFSDWPHCEPERNAGGQSRQSQSPFRRATRSWRNLRVSGYSLSASGSNSDRGKSAFRSGMASEAARNGLPRSSRSTPLSMRRRSSQGRGNQSPAGPIPAGPGILLMHRT